MGIDSLHFIRSICFPLPPSKHLFLHALNPAFEAKVLAHLDVLDANSIHPLFVFPGVLEINALVRKEGELNAREKEFRERGKEAEQSSLPDNAFNYFAKLKAILLKRNVSFINAPFNQFRTLERLVSKFAIQCVFSSSECLLYIRDKLILSIRDSNVSYILMQFEFINKDVLLKTIGLNHFQFIDLCLMCGTEFTPTFPPLVNPLVYQLDIGFSLPDCEALYKVRGQGSMPLLFMQFQSPEMMVWRQKYLRGKVAILNQPSLMEGGKMNLGDFKVTPMPKNVEDVFVPWISRENFLALLHSITSVNAVETLIWKKVIVSSFGIRRDWLDSIWKSVRGIDYEIVAMDEKGSWVISEKNSKKEIIEAKQTKSNDFFKGDTFASKVFNIYSSVIDLKSEKYADFMAKAPFAESALLLIEVAKGWELLSKCIDDIAKQCTDIGMFGYEVDYTSYLGLALIVSLVPYEGDVGDVFDKNVSALGYYLNAINWKHHYVCSFASLKTFMQTPSKLPMTDSVFRVPFRSHLDLNMAGATRLLLYLTTGEGRDNFVERMLTWVKLVNEFVSTTPECPKIFSSSFSKMYASTGLKDL